MQGSRFAWIFFAGSLVLGAACDSRAAPLRAAAPSAVQSEAPVKPPVTLAAGSSPHLAEAQNGDGGELSGSGRRPPECYDERTTGAVLDLIREKMLPGEAYRRMSKEAFDAAVTIDAARATSWNRDIAQYECAAVVIVDASAGADRIGRAVLMNPQRLQNAGSSVAEVEGVIRAGMSPDGQKFSYSIAFSSQLAGDRQYIAVTRISDVHALLTGSFAAAYAERVTGTDRAAGADDLGTQ